MTQTPKVKADRLKPVKQSLPTDPARLTDLIIAGIHALADGNATSQQQKGVLEWIVNEASMAGAIMYQPDHQRNTDYGLGRAFVGQQIIGILKIPMMNFSISEAPPERPEPKPTKKKE